MIKTIAIWIVLFWIFRKLTQLIVKNPKNNVKSHINKSSRKDGLDIKDAEFEDID
jgi:hypothetical protein